VPQPPKANTHGRSLVARSSPVAGLAVVAGPAVAESARLLVATDRRLAAVTADGAPIEDSTRTYPLVKLQPTEAVAAVASAV
jgi:hypothetical protein